MISSKTKVVKVNLTSMVDSAVHRPRVTLANGLNRPLYAHIKNPEEGTFETDWSIKLDTDPKAQAAITKGNFNSASNIRAIIITADKVYVKYYVNSVCGHTFSDSRTFKSSDEITVREMLKNNEELNAARMCPEMLPDTTEYINYDIDGDVYSILRYPYRCSNIEELYFSEDVFNLANARFMELSQDEINALKSHQKEPFMLHNETISKAFLDSVRATPEKLAVLFPRLRAVGMLGEDLIHNIIDNDIVSNTYKLPAVEELKSGTFTYGILDAVKKIQKGGVIINIINNESMNSAILNKQFIVRNNAYKFDADIFSKFVEKNEKKITGLIIGKDIDPDAPSVAQVVDSSIGNEIDSLDDTDNDAATTDSKNTSSICTCLVSMYETIYDNNSDNTKKADSVLSKVIKSTKHSLNAQERVTFKHELENMNIKYRNKFIGFYGADV